MHRLEKSWGFSTLGVEGVKARARDLKMGNLAIFIFYF